MMIHSRMWRIAKLAACLMASGAASGAEVDSTRIVAADKEPQNWLSNGRTYSEQRFSPLAKITAANVAELLPAWSHDIKSRTARGLEATPIVFDGVIHTSGAWSHVLALEAKSGKVLWEFDPQIPGTATSSTAAVAVWGGKVFIGAYDAG
jgi:quinohemoprotein ethanol dehydrogenase